MSDPELSKYIPENFEILVRKNAMDCFYYEVTEGDSLRIIEYDFKKLVKVAKRIIEDTNDLKENPEIRIAIDFGSIVYSQAGGIVTKIKTGEPLRTSARLEPYVKPNEIWFTENCLKSELDNSIKYTELHDNEVDLTPINGKYNLKKKDSSEPGILMNLYKII
jgi:class 3 adenylate cyclase